MRNNLTRSLSGQSNPTPTATRHRAPRSPEFDPRFFVTNGNTQPRIDPDSTLNVTVGNTQPRINRADRVVPDRAVHPPPEPHAPNVCAIRSPAASITIG